MKLGRQQVSGVFDALASVCPSTDAVTSDIITVVLDEQNLLGKNFTLTPDGSIKKKSAGAVERGIACQYCVPDLGTLKDLLRIVSDNPHAAIINAGWKHTAIGEQFVFLSKKRLLALGLEPDAVTIENGMPAFARLKVHATPSSWQLLDRDEDKFTPEWATNQSFDEWRMNLDKILPGIATVKMLQAHSSSARVLDTDGKAVGGGNGHVWIKVADADDAERTRTAIQARALEHGLAWTKPRLSKSTGTDCGHGFATIVDASVWTIGRLVFVGQPTCSTGLVVAPQKFQDFDGEDDSLDTSKAVISVLKTFRASLRQGAPMRLARNGASYRSVMNNLRLGTEIELEGGSVKTVRDLIPHLTEKIRCQSPFRESNSMAAFLALDRNGEPFVFDSGTDTHHVLASPSIARSEDNDREKLVKEMQWRLGDMIGATNALAVFDAAVLRTSWDSTFCTPNNNKIALLNQNNDVVDLTVSDVTMFGLRRSFGRVFHPDLLDESVAEKGLPPKDDEALRKTLRWLEYGPLIQLLKLLKQAKSLDVSVNMFVTRGKLTLADGIATIVLPHRMFVARSIVEMGLVDRVVSDYQEHFPEFHAFLELILYARFASDRRHAFVWLHSPSSWGKGFLLAVFQALGLVVEISASEIEKAMAGAPVGLSLFDTLRTWILFVDEFKAASSELKLLNKQVSISPKNQLRCTVQLYTKLFASAENVRSLVGDGVEAQFNNRFAYLSPITEGLKLEDRPLFIELSKAVYLDALVCYVADYLNEGVDRFRAMGPTASSKMADHAIEAYQAERRLQTKFGSLDEAIDDLAGEIRRCLIEYAQWHTSGADYRELPDIVQGIGLPLVNTLKRTTLIGHVSGGEHSKQRYRAIVLGEPVAFVKNYVALSGDRSTVAKVQYKAEDIARKVNMRRDATGGRVRVYDVSGSCLENKRGAVVFLDPVPDSNHAPMPPWVTA